MPNKMIDSIQKLLIEGEYKEPISKITRLIEKQNGMEINIVGFRKEWEGQVLYA